MLDTKLPIHLTNCDDFRQTNLPTSVTVKEVAQVLRWGTYGANRAHYPNVKWYKLIDLSIDHIRNILRTETYHLSQLYIYVLKKLLAHKSKEAKKTIISNEYEGNQELIVKEEFFIKLCNGKTIRATIVEDGILFYKVNGTSIDIISKRDMAGIKISK